MEAILWYNKLKSQELFQPNDYTISSMMKPFANIGDLKACEELENALKGKSQCNVFTYSYLVKACINSGNLEKVIPILHEMKELRIEPNHLVFIPILKEATNSNRIDIGTTICEMIKQSRLENVQILMAVGTFLLKTGKPNLAIKEFQIIKEKYRMDVISWTCLIQAYIENRQIKEALKLLEMEQENIKPDAKTFVVLLKSCTIHEYYKEGYDIIDMAHRKIQEFPIELYTSIICLYTKGGKPAKALELCNKLKRKDLTLWNCQIQALVDLGNIQHAIACISLVKEQNLTPDSKTFTILIKACANLQLFQEGEVIFKMARNANKELSMELWAVIITFYSKCGKYETAIKICENLKRKNKMDIVIWTCFIQSHIALNRLDVALSIFSEIQQTNILLDSTIFSILIQACTRNKLFDEGVKLHKCAMDRLENISVHLQSTIFTMYISNGQPEYVIEECNKLKQDNRMDLILWNCLIMTYSKLDMKLAMDCLTEMQLDIKPDSYTFTILLTECANEKLFEEGNILIQLARRSIPKFTDEISTSIVNFYTKCGEPEMAIEECQILKRENRMNLQTWTCLIQAFSELDPYRSIESFYEMLNSGINPDFTIFSIIITICSKAQLFKEGEEFCKMVLEEHYEKVSNELIVSIANFYIESGNPEKAIEECEKHSNGNVSIWNCLIKAYSLLNMKRAMEIFNEMKEFNILPDSITFTILISACTKLELFKEGEELCTLAIEKNVELTIELITSIVNFNTKRGNSKFTIRECEKLRQQGKMDIFLWNCLIQSHIQQEDIDSAMNSYREMKESTEPDTHVEI